MQRKMIYLGCGNKCCGCTTCLNICPKNAILMATSKEGFLYPAIDSNKCIECHACENNCAWLNKKENVNESNVFYAAKRKDFKKRMQSQSGGAFSVLAEEILSKHGVIYGVAFIGDEARYIRVTSKRHLSRLKGSKYLQAKVGNVFNIVASDLNNDKTVLFSGTACHVDGLIHYLNFKKIDTKKLITVDIICHGVVSPQIYLDYKNYIEKIHNGKLKWFNFRDKSFGWHGHIITYKIGHTIYKSKDYVKIFYSSYALRKTCYECQYANLKRISDITIGDAWGIGDHFPEFDDNKGCSLIIVNSEKGKNLFSKVSGQFGFIKINKGQALQPNLQHPTEKPIDYDKFWDDYFKFGFEYVVYKYCEFGSIKETIILKKHQLIKRIVKKVKGIFGL